MNGIKVRINQSHSLDYFFLCCVFFWWISIEKERVRERARPYYSASMICCCCPCCHNSETTWLLLSVVHMHVHKTGSVVFPMQVRAEKFYPLPDRLQRRLHHVQLLSMLLSTPSTLDLFHCELVKISLSIRVCSEIILTRLSTWKRWLALSGLLERPCIRWRSSSIAGPCSRVGERLNTRSTGGSVPHP